MIKFKELSDTILRCFYEVYNELGRGFLESVYREALMITLQEAGLNVKKEKEINVYFRNKNIGRFRADIVVENKIILELKAVKHLVPEHEAQLLNYLRATNIEVGFLLNFGDEPKFIRRFYENERKNNTKD
jgi:GxxExxY protein